MHLISRNIQGGFMAGKVINVGIAGLGRSGWNIHAGMLGAVEDRFRVTAVFDRDKSRLDEAKKRFGCNTYESYDEFLKDSSTELIVVATPNNMHADCSIKAMKAGKHAVCEKPMAVSLSEADSMIAASKETGRVLAVFQNYRYFKNFLQVKRVIDSGVLGRITLIRITYHGFSRRWDWQTLKKYNGGSMNNTTPHPLDQAMVLFGSREPEIFCIRDRTLTLGDADDHVKIILHGKGSPTIEIEVMSDCAYPQPMWLVMGTQGGLTGTNQELKWKYFNPANLPGRKVSEEPTPDRKYNSEKIEFTEETWSEKEDRGPGPNAFYPDLYETLRNGKPLYITPESVRRQIQVLDKCRELAPV